MNRDTHLIFENYEKKNIVSEGVGDWMWTAAKVLDPTGVLSYGDLKKATEVMAKDFTTVNIILFFLAVFAALPNFGLLAAGVGGAPWAAAKAMARGAAKNPKLLAKAGDTVLSLLKHTPGAFKGLEKTTQRLVADKVITSGQAKSLLGMVEKGKTFTITNREAGLVAKGSKATQFASPRKLAAQAAGPIAINDMGRRLLLRKGTRGQTAARLLQSTGITGAISGTPGKLQDTSTSPAESPFGPQTPEQQYETEVETGQQEMPGSSGMVYVGNDQNGQPVYIPQTQFATTGGAGFQTDPISKKQYGVMSAPNLPQGATLEDPYGGRQAMPPQEYMQPDNFNYPPGYQGPPEANLYPRQQQYNPYNQYGQPNQGGLVGAIAQPLLGTMGSVFGGPQGGAYAGAMLNPVNNLGGLASGLLNILPGIGGIM